MFCVSFVAITVRARVQGMDRSLEEAAGDLGADPRTTFFKVTLPNILPGVIAGGLLAFALSIDDYVITNFVAGSKTTFPLWVFGATRQGIPVQVNVMGTLLFMFGILIVRGQLWRFEPAGTRRQEAPRAGQGPAGGRPDFVKVFTKSQGNCL